jgi:hypothetical protein
MEEAGKLETRTLFAGRQGGTVARAGGNTCGPVSARLAKGPPRSPRRIRTTPDSYLSGIDSDGKVAKASARRRFRALELNSGRTGRLTSRVGHGYQLLRLTLERKHFYPLDPNSPSPIIAAALKAAGLVQELIRRRLLAMGTKGLPSTPCKSSRSTVSFGVANGDTFDTMHFEYRPELL